MRYLVTGSSGLIGTALCAALRGDGHDVVQLVRRQPAGPDERGWDPAAGKIDESALAGIDGVVNLNGVGIAEHRWTDDQKQLILDSRVDSTSTLATAIASADAPPAAFVSASGVDYYGSSEADDGLTEQSAAGDGFLADVCREWEAATEPAAQAGVRTVVLRTGIVLSPDGGPLARQLLPFKLGLGGRLGTGDQWISWISLHDQIRVIRRALEDQALAGPLNATTPNPVRQREFANTLGTVLSRPTLLPTPVVALRALYGSELVRTLLLEGQRVLPAALVDAGFEFEHPDLEGALRAMLGR